MCTVRFGGAEVKAQGGLASSGGRIHPRESRSISNFSIRNVNHNECLLGLNKGLTEFFGRLQCKPSH